MDQASFLPTSVEERNARLDEIIRIIEGNPDHWNQNYWHCGTSHCFAGFAQCKARGLDWELPLERAVQEIHARPLNGFRDLTYGIKLADGFYADTDEDAAYWLGLIDPVYGHSQEWPGGEEPEELLHELDRCYCCSDVLETLFDPNNSLDNLKLIVSLIKEIPLPYSEADHATNSDRAD